MTKFNVFNSFPGRQKTSLDYTNKFVPAFKKIPPFTKNDKGEILNDTRFYKIVENGKINIYEKIQSYMNEVNIYTILERYLNTGDSTLLNQNTQGSYIDVSELPSDFHEMSKLVASSSSIDIDKLIKDYFDKKMAENKATSAANDKATSAANDKATSAANDKATSAANDSEVENNV